MSSEAKKKKYKVVNWKEYNQALVDRGDFTLWISEEVIEQWRHDNKESKIGRPFVYSDMAIETILTLRELFRLRARTNDAVIVNQKSFIALRLLPFFSQIFRGAPA